MGSVRAGHVDNSGRWMWEWRRPSPSTGPITTYKIRELLGCGARPGESALRPPVLPSEAPSSTDRVSDKSPYPTPGSQGSYKMPWSHLQIQIVSGQADL